MFAVKGFLIYIMASDGCGEAAWLTARPSKGADKRREDHHQLDTCDNGFLFHE